MTAPRISSERMRSSGRAATRLWARRELRRRWIAVVLLGVLAGLAAAVSLSALAGARRSATAFDRLRDATDAADAVIFASQVDIFAPDWSRVMELPYVESAGSFGITFSPVVDGPPGKDLSDIGYFTVASGEWRTRIDRPIITAGRAPDPSNPHEVLAPSNAGEAGIEIGQQYVIALPSAEQAAAGDLFSEPQGERVTVEVVGLGTSTFELAVIPSGADTFVTTRAFDEQYSDASTFIDNLLVRFKPGQGSVAQLERDARRLLDSPTLPVLDTKAVSKRVTNGTGLEATGLAMFAMAVAMSAAVLVGQALTRSVRAGAVDVGTLRAIGATRRDLRGGLALPHLPVVVVAVAVGFAGAVALSPRFPIGLGRTVDPDVGTHVDWTVLGPGIALAAIVLATTILVTAHRAAAPSDRQRAPRSSRVVALLARAGARPVVTLGASMALEPGRDRRALPTRPALAGMAVGVLGVVGAQTLLGGMNDAITNPERFGATWSIEAAQNDAHTRDEWEQEMRTIESDRAVRGSAEAGKALIVIDGVTQPTYTIVPRRGTVDFTVISGRRPSAPGEIALGPETAESYGVGVGDTVEAVSSKGDDITLTVVGLALLPTTPHSSYDQGAWVGREQLVQLAGGDIGEATTDDPFATPVVVPAHLSVLVTGADVTTTAERLAGLVDPERVNVEPSPPPIDIRNLRNVRSLPALFSVFTVLLALGTVAHVCVSTVRRRGIDLAVIRALGATPRGAGAVLAWQATTLSVIGVLVGVPLGVIVGRTAWRIVADETPLLFVAPVAVVALLLAAPVAIVAANLLALLPGRAAARLRPADLLRSE